MKITNDKKSRIKPSGDMSDANTYHKNAIAYCQSSGRADGSHPVIVKGTNEWNLWMRYFDHIGHLHAKPDSYANKSGKLTVPALSPDEFEPGWLASEKREYPKYVKTEIRKDAGLSEAEKLIQRATISKIFDETMHSLKNSVTMGKKTEYEKRWKPPTKEQAEHWLKKHEGGKDLPPVTIGNSLREYLKTSGIEDTFE
jgi:hypothetical protein